MYSQVCKLASRSSFSLSQLGLGSLFIYHHTPNLYQCYTLILCCLFSKSIWNQNDSYFQYDSNLICISLYLEFVFQLNTMFTWLKYLTYIVFYISKIYNQYQISNDIQFCNSHINNRKSRKPSLFLALVVDSFLLVPLFVTKFEIWYIYIFVLYTLDFTILTVNVKILLKLHKTVHCSLFYYCWTKILQ